MAAPENRRWRLRPQHAVLSRSAEDRNAYLYVPKESEDFIEMVKHLNQAGVVVLLALSEAQRRQIRQSRARQRIPVK